MKTYIAITGLVALIYLASGFFYLSGAPNIVEGMATLGYPATFVTLLGTWKLLGGLALAVPQVPARLKEWAYAGMFFNLTAAIYTHIRHGDAASTLIAPVAILGLVATSYYLRLAQHVAPATSNERALPLGFAR